MCGRLPRPAFALRASAKRGGARRDRTADLVIANDALSQLSYGPFRDRLIAENRRRIVAPFKSATSSSQERVGGNASPEALKSAAFPAYSRLLSLVCRGWN